MLRRPSRQQDTLVVLLAQKRDEVTDVLRISLHRGNGNVVYIPSVHVRADKLKLECTFCLLVIRHRHDAFEHLLTSGQATFFAATNKTLSPDNIQLADGLAQGKTAAGELFAAITVARAHRDEAGAVAVAGRDGDDEELLTLEDGPGERMTRCVNVGLRDKGCEEARGVCAGG